VRECSERELRALAALGRNGSLSMSDLAAILKVPLSTATHTVNRLVVKGLIERRRAKHDRRVVRVTFSQKGQEINRFVENTREAEARRMLESLPVHDRQALLRWLSTMAGAGKREAGTLPPPPKLK
jgi:DNA-binding MarR family transcriptional regulator